MKKISAILLLLGVPFFLFSILDLLAANKDYSPENAFYSMTEYYDRADADTKVFVIEDLTPIKWFGTTHYGDEIQYLCTFTDATGSVHYILLEVTPKEQIYEKIMEARNTEDDTIISGLTITGVFSRVQFPTMVPNFYGPSTTPELEAEVHRYSVAYEAGSEDYQTFIEKFYRLKMMKKLIITGLSLAAIVVGVIILIKLATTRGSAVMKRRY